MKKEVDIKSLFDEILLSKNKKQKIDIIKKFAEKYKYVKSLLVLITHDGLNHTITKNAMQKLNIKFSEKHQTNIFEFLKVVKNLNKTKNRKERYELIKGFLSKCDKDRGYYYEMILSDSLKIGIGRKTIDEIFNIIRDNKKKTKVSNTHIEQPENKNTNRNYENICMYPEIITSISDKDVKMIKDKYNSYEECIKGDRCILVFDNKSFNTYSCDGKEGIYNKFFNDNNIFSYHLITILQKRIFDGKIFDGIYYVYDVVSTDDLNFGMGYSKYGLTERRTILKYLITLINSDKIKLVNGITLKDFTKDNLIKLSKMYKNERSSGVILKQEHSIYKFGKQSNLWLKLDL